LQIYQYKGKIERRKASKILFDSLDVTVFNVKNIASFTKNFEEKNKEENMNKKQKNRKSVLQNRRNKMVNRRYSSTVKTLTKLFFNKLQKYSEGPEKDENTLKQKEIQLILNKIYSMVDKGIKKNVFHKNTGDRKKSRVAKFSFQIFSKKKIPNNID
jgi:small subunit ribosomal protein S20